MTVKILCDRCKREFECDEDLAESLDEIICQDCQDDIDLYEDIDEETLTGRHPFGN